MKKHLEYTIEKEIKQIKIGKTKYRIFLCKHIKLSNINLLGFIDYEYKSIFLKKEQKNIKQTLLHELTHAIFEEIAKKSKRNKRKWRKLRSNESLIEYFSKLIEDLNKSMEVSQ